MKLGIIGSGYVGLVTGTCFAHLGHQVHCVDRDKAKLLALTRGKSPIYEPGLEELIRENMKAGRLSFGVSIAEAVKKAEVLFICVNTPPKKNGEADLSFVEAVSSEIARSLKRYRLIVEKSTVPVQTGERIGQTMRRVQPDKSLFDVASNPEFLREGSAVEDFLNPDRIILGVENDRSKRLLTELYKPFKRPMVVTDLKSAEIIKHASNSFLAAKISFINAVSRVCDAAGADIHQVALGMGMDPRIGPAFLKAGIGFGGFCFPKDLAAFIRMCEKLGVSFDLLQSVLDGNEEQKRHFVRKIEHAMWNLNHKTLAVLGLSFKPNTDDIRFAPAIDIIQKLQKEGVKVQAYDPQAMPKAKRVLKKVQFKKNPYEALKGADAMLLMTEWDEFKALDFKRVKKLLKLPMIFDGRNLYDMKALEKLGFQYYGMGRQLEEKE